MAKKNKGLADMDWELEMEILKVSFRNIKDIEIISFAELSEEQRTLFMDVGGESNFIKQMAGLIHMSLINPKRWEEFGSLNMDEFLEFFTKWVKLSEETKKKK